MCGRKQFPVYSQLANYSGLQTGWSADILKEKFNVKLNIIPDGDGVYQTRMEDGNLGDIIVWGNNGDDYAAAVKAGVLYDWNEDDILTNEGAYIKKNMPDAIKKNKELTSKITEGKEEKVYGIGSDVALSNEDHQMFFYNWDIRWDLYKELGYPKVKDLDDLEELLTDMQKLCPKDDAGNKTYAVSLWPDWDKDMVMYVKAMATAYYGYDELGIGLYDSRSGEFHGALEENGPYLEMLKFFNRLYQRGLLDPDSNGETYNSENWKSNISEAESEIEQDWRDYNNCKSIEEYFEKGDYVVAPGTSFTLETKSTEFKTTWSQVTDEIKNGSWKAIYAETDADYDKAVSKMISSADKYGYEECVKWTEGQAKIRHELEVASQGVK